MSENRPADCVSAATLMRCDFVLWNPSDPEKPCQCGQLINDGPLGLTDTSVPRERGSLEVIQLRAMPRLAGELTAISYSVFEFIASYYRVIVNNDIVPAGFSVSQPAGAWTSLGQMTISECIDTCSRESDLFLMVRTVDDATSCWSAPLVDMSLLRQQFPSVSGEYQVLDLSVMKIGTKITVTHSAGFNVSSTGIKNGYRGYAVKMPGEAQWAPQPLLLQRHLPCLVRENRLVESLNLVDMCIYCLYLLQMFNVHGSYTIKVLYVHWELQALGSGISLVVLFFRLDLTT
ncbi:hypothetical protein FJT64_020086 [Amphibalanus amphitrite]|uniref:Uncharacterized protein n=1 Tax=Amphibalanus amphitrite TaxID=1232801 RepID=A0A6A4X1L0_AMPAM|nr:hypothetical protein FJT64_020086 [Amphibalanus amphitrite]